MPRQLGSVPREERDEMHDPDLKTCPICGGQMHDCEAGYTNCARCNSQPMCATCLVS